MKNIILKICNMLHHITIATPIALISIRSAYARSEFSISNTEWQTLVNPPLTPDWQFSTTGTIKVPLFELWGNQFISIDNTPCLFISKSVFDSATVFEPSTVVLIVLGLIAMGSGRLKDFYK